MLIVTSEMNNSLLQLAHDHFQICFGLMTQFSFFHYSHILSHTFLCFNLDDKKINITF